MTPERYRQIGELYHAALEVDAAERAVFLARACADDAELRRQVESLINSHEQAADFIAAPALEVAAEMLAGDETDALTGRTIAHYRVLSLVGAGGMGRVYLAEDTELGRRVALKFLPEYFTHDKNQVQRFRQEARAASALNHPNILTVYEVGQVNGLEFIATEFVEGETLRHHLAQSGIKLSELIEVAMQIASALAAVHQIGVIHRDIKPDNIMVRRDGLVKVLDFGLVKLMRREAMSIDAEASTRAMVATDPGVVMGTAHYMSPEQAQSFAVDARTDIWSLGVVLYEMAAGRVPFEGATASHVIVSILEKDPLPLSRYAPEVPGEFVRIISKALEKDREERYQVVKDLALDLKKLKQQLEFEMALGRSAAPESAGGTTGVQRARIRSLAVLPLENLSPNREEEYFADGMTDALITTLAQIGVLRVISRTSVMRYKGARKPLPEIARELRVDAVIEGTVVRSGNRVRIAAQLILAATDTHLWAKSYESDLRDILALQSNVARTIAHEIQIKLTPQEKARLAEVGPVDPGAYEAFLNGRHHWYRRSPDALKRALYYLQQATAKDPTYALAYAGLADAYNSLGWDLYAILAPAESFPKAKEAAKRALELDPNCAEAHAALGWAAAAYDWDWVAAATEFQRAIELKPQYGPVHIWYSHFLKAMGRTRESFEESRLALECDPLGLVLNMHMGWHYLYLRKYQEAIEQLLKTLELDPGFIPARMFLGEAYEQMGMFAEAITEFEEAVNRTNRQPIYLAGLGHAYAVSGNRDEAFHTIEELNQLSTQKFVPARGVAEIYMGLGDKEQAFAWLDKAFEQRNGWLFHVKENQRYDNLRTDPRYIDLVRRLGLPQ